MAWSLVCPASRGIGFQLTRRLLETTHLPVVATARSDASKVKKSILEDLTDVDEKRLTVLELDVTGKDKSHSSRLDLRGKPPIHTDILSRRGLHPKSSRQSRISLPTLKTPSPPRLLPPRNPLSRKITSPTRPETNARNIRRQHNWSPPLIKTLHPLLTQEIDKTLRTGLS